MARRARGTPRGRTPQRGPARGCGGKVAAARLKPSTHCSSGQSLPWSGCTAPAAASCPLQRAPRCVTRPNRPAWCVWRAWLRLTRVGGSTPRAWVVGRPMGAARCAGRRGVLVAGRAAPARAVLRPSCPGPHPGCPGLRNSRWAAVPRTCEAARPPAERPAFACPVCAAGRCWTSVCGCSLSHRTYVCVGPERAVAGRRGGPILPSTPGARTGVGAREGTRHQEGRHGAAR